VLSFIQYNYNIDKASWKALWTGYRSNVFNYTRWCKRGISSYKMNKILGDFDEERMELVKRKRYTNSVVLSYSAPIFINTSRSDYIIEITSHCYGTCSSSYAYFVHYTKETNSIEIMHKILTSVS